MTQQPSQQPKAAVAGQRGAPSALERIGGLGWAHLLNDGAANFLPGVLPAILIELNFSVGLAGPIVAALLIGQGLQPFIGLLGDRIGGRGLLIAGLIGSSLGAVLVAVANSAATLIVALLAIGVSNSLFHPQLLAGARRIPGQRQATAMSAVLIGGEIGRGLWPALASAIVVAGGRGWLAVLAVPGLLTVLLLFRWAPILPAKTRDAAPIAWRHHAVPLICLVAYCGLRGLIIFALITFLPLIWTRAGGGMTAGASLITALYVVGIVGNLGGGWLGDRIGKRIILIVSIAATLVCVAAIALLHGPSLWLTSSLAGVAVFATLPLTVIIAQDIVPESPAFGSGLALGLANALGALGLVVISPLADSYSVEAPLWAAFGAGLVALMLALLMPLPARRGAAA